MSGKLLDDLGELQRAVIEEVWEHTTCIFLFQSKHYMMLISHQSICCG